MTTTTEQRRRLVLGWVLLLGLWFAAAVWAEDTPPPGVRPATLSAGEFHTCGVRSNGIVACWGVNYAGQASPPTGTFTQVSAGEFHTCRVRSNGTEEKHGGCLEGVGCGARQHLLSL